MTQNYRRFPSIRRLCRDEDYRYVFSNPHKYSTRYFTILYRSNGMSHPRLGFAISKRTIRKAVTRNRLKRLIRENFRLNQQYLRAFDIVFLVNREIPAGSNEALFENQPGLWNPLFKP